MYQSPKSIQSTDSPEVSDPGFLQDLRIWWGKSSLLWKQITVTSFILDRCIIYLLKKIVVKMRLHFLIIVTIVFLSLSCNVVPSSAKMLRWWRRKSCPGEIPQPGHGHGHTAPYQPLSHEPCWKRHPPHPGVRDATWYRHRSIWTLKLWLMDQGSTSIPIKQRKN